MWRGSGRKVRSVQELKKRRALESSRGGGGGDQKVYRSTKGEEATRESTALRTKPMRPCTRPTRRLLLARPSCAVCTPRYEMPVSTTSATLSRVPPALAGHDAHMRAPAATQPATGHTKLFRGRVTTQDISLCPFNTVSGHIKLFRGRITTQDISLCTFNTVPRGSPGGNLIRRRSRASAGCLTRGGGRGG